MDFCDVGPFQRSSCAPAYRQGCQVVCQILGALFREEISTCRLELGNLVGIHWGLDNVESIALKDVATVFSSTKLTRFQ